MRREPSGTNAPAARRTLFRGGQVFDGSRFASTDLVVADGVIVDVGPGLDGDEEIALDGLSVLPGLFDCHVHLTTSGVDYWRLAQQPFSYRFFEAVRNMRLTLGAGITFVRDAAGADLGLKRAVADGLVAGPDMRIAISMISQTGGHADPWLPSGSCLPALFPPHPGAPHGVADGPESVRRKAREILRAGADMLKVAASGGVLSARDDPHHAQFRADELRELVSEAAAADTYVMAHAHSAAGIKAAVRAGARSIEHGVFLDDECLELMVDSGTYLVPTLSAAPRLVEAAACGAAFPDGVVAQAVEVVAAHRDAFTRALQAGVRVAMGTDSGVGPHGHNLDELHMMSEAGMPHPAVLRSATIDAARLLGVADVVGEIAPGKRADLVVVANSPVDFEKLSENIVAVYQAGRLVHGDDPAGRSVRSSAISGWSE
ncbi:amidohydrolase family protein [Kibdelosporangium persicum]|uniref:Metal-dependent hydrolase n=1 Tax=Kibdelosporangium persicum TaxID=2698649 RepID=A0ABX2FID1_9PSEU|nr:amidohydrolase family protein [Kibdelosporangium persicum]NRN70998.1 Metal-dependent hydrolase [Kibdelosporangium persicum]